MWAIPARPSLDRSTLNRLPILYMTHAPDEVAQRVAVIRYFLHVIA